MVTLDPGIHNPEDAPWWRFTCEGYDPVIRQWMGEAANLFAAQLASRNAGGEVLSVFCAFTSSDGMTGTYQVKLSEHSREYILTITRDPDHPITREDLPNERE